jgi:hypothetical protein
MQSYSLPISNLINIWLDSELWKTLSLLWARLWSLYPWVACGIKKQVSGIMQSPYGIHTGLLSCALALTVPVFSQGLNLTATWPIICEPSILTSQKENSSTPVHSAGMPAAIGLRSTTSFWESVFEKITLSISWWTGINTVDRMFKIIC